MPSRFLRRASARDLGLIVTFPLLLAATDVPGQEAGGYSVGPGKETTYQTVVEGYKPSPQPTQDRLFAGTRLWRLDAGRFEVEQWWRARQHRDGTGSEHLFQTEIEIGLTDHIQIDIYENLQIQPGQTLDQEGNQIEMRYSIASSYGQIWGNPTLYLEWHPRHNAPDRAEGRVLLGGTLFAPEWIGAANFFYEQNIETNTLEGRDAEMGVQAAASYGFFNGHLRLGGEVKVGVDQHGGPTFKPMFLGGPNALLRLGPFKLTGTFFVGFLDNDPRFEPYLIAGLAF